MNKRINTSSTNLRQKEFYETKKKNPAIRLWSYFRNGLLNKIRKNIGIEQQVYELHKMWMGALSQKKVLDLGCNDPLQTSMPIKVIRTIYRPFQSDKAWEWPFSKKTYRQYEEAFEIKERRGVLGKAKWRFLMNLLPLSSEKKKSIGEKWHLQDRERSQTSGSCMFSCMHLSILMQKKGQG